MFVCPASALRTRVACCLRFSACHIVLIVLAAVLLLNGFFAAAEVALISVRKSRLRAMADEGQVGAQAALNLLANPARLLSVTQAGVTLASLGLGWAGENTVYDLFLAILNPLIRLRWQPWLHGVSFGIAFLLISYAHVVIGEVVPKNLAIEKADRLAILVAPVLLVFDRISAPFVFVAEAVRRRRSHAGSASRAATPAGGHSAEELKFIVSSSRRKDTCIASRKTPSRRCSNCPTTTLAKSWCRATPSSRCRWTPASIRFCGKCARPNIPGCRCIKANPSTSSATFTTRT